MPLAQVMLRADPVYRAEAFRLGLQRAGYNLEQRIHLPRKGDVLVIWNRYGQFAAEAERFAAAGAHVLVAENGYLGREWNGNIWYALARGFHNGAGGWPAGNEQRWGEIGTEVAPWRQGGCEIVVLATRNIGPQGVAEPRGWSEATAARLQSRTSRPVRIRKHPGEKGRAVPLLGDLRNAWAVVTWGSGAALKAIVAGIPAFYGFEPWIGRGAALPVSEDLEQPFRGDRLPMLRSLAWAMWRVDEIEAGEPFRELLPTAA